jgi:hypothetical protein
MGGGILGFTLCLMSVDTTRHRIRFRTLDAATAAQLTMEAGGTIRRFSPAHLASARPIPWAGLG